MDEGLGEKQVQEGMPPWAMCGTVPDRGRELAASVSVPELPREAQPGFSIDGATLWTLTATVLRVFYHSQIVFF